MRDPITFQRAIDMFGQDTCDQMAGAAESDLGAPLAILAEVLTNAEVPDKYLVRICNGLADELHALSQGSRELA